ncbi:hypothetical protein C8D72_0597 [Kushneria indalinina DSM 14324]|uniref:Uncharacterized protein n=1 Tax=Kushneria indalinina DSM 14324 TaxID=1122140 RepID=A0A3D9DYT5_9GAMM|nr:hypothetical protein C8D72_0597 [Kushneria indalinina DSM 14324]
MHDSVCFIELGRPVYHDTALSYQQYKRSILRHFSARNTFKNATATQNMFMLKARLNAILASEALFLSSHNETLSFFTYR